MAHPVLKRLAPRWIIFLCDIVLISASFFISFLLVNRFAVHEAALFALRPAFFTNFLIGLVCIQIFAIYKGIIRYSEISDIARVLKFAVLQFFIWNIVYFFDTDLLVSGQVSHILLLINFFAVVFILSAFRILVKEVYNIAQLRPRPKFKAMIFGAGQLGQITMKVLEQDENPSAVRLVGFIDHHFDKIGKKLGGFPIYNASGGELAQTLKAKGITHVYIAINNLPVERKIAITDICGPLKIQVSVVPPPSQLTEGSFEKKQIREINIEELLGRDEIDLPKSLLQDTYRDAVVLVTGAAGSIGSEICRQLCKNQVGKLILLDQSETGLFDLENELLAKVDDSIVIQVEIASVRDIKGLEKVFSANRPQYVFHAAAYKHVPLMEKFPCEAIMTNIIGTKNVADLSLHYRAKKFVLVSSDKAVNPTNIMGATKRVSELYVQQLSDQDSPKTQFVITRFGNVLGSAGSVVPTFKKQIEQGGPVCITHPDITRYFMTIPEASKLVLEAGEIGETGDILLFDMGKPVKVLDLAIRMIHLKGLEPYKDIDIVFTALRPGEKMYEELFKDTEEFIKTDHPRILRGVKSKTCHPELSPLLHDLELHAAAHKHDIVPGILKNILSEFTPYLYLANHATELPVTDGNKQSVRRTVAMRFVR